MWNSPTALSVKSDALITRAREMVGRYVSGTGAHNDGPPVSQGAPVPASDLYGAVGSGECLEIAVKLGTLHSGEPHPH